MLETQEVREWRRRIRREKEKECRGRGKRVRRRATEKLGSE